jgi:hypothetical protein
MARIVLVGLGPLPRGNPEALGFSQLRTGWFLEALGARHDVHPILIQEGGETGFSAVNPAEAGWLEAVAAHVDAVAPDLVVSAGPYDAARAAALCAGDRPLWIDVPGDPFAEAQAKAAQGGAGAQREMLAAYGMALARADAFSTISRAQRHALVGQLGVIGRLEQAPVDAQWVFSLPAVFGFGDLAPAPPRVRAPGSPLVVALSGGFNTWFDGETLLTGLHRAMDRVDLRVVSTGGGIAGHHASTYEVFRKAALSGPHPRRFTFHGWVPHDRVPACLGESHLGISLDRPGFEPELGTRTRVLFFFHQGMEVLTTLGCDLCQDMASHLHGVPVEDAVALADKLVWIHEHGQDGARAAAGRAWLEDRCSLEQVMAPLMDWVESPVRIPQVEDRSAALAEELARVRSELAAVHATPTWKASEKASGLLKSVGFLRE